MKNTSWSNYPKLKFSFMKTTVNEAKNEDTTAKNEDDGATTYIVLGISNNDTEK